MILGVLGILGLVLQEKRKKDATPHRHFKNNPFQNKSYENSQKNRRARVPRPNE